MLIALGMNKLLWHKKNMNIRCSGDGSTVDLSEKFTIKLKFKNISIEKILEMKDGLVKANLHDYNDGASSSVSLFGAKYATFFIEDPEHEEDFQKTRKSHQQIVDGFEKLKSSMFLDISNGPMANKVSMHLKNRLEYPASWFKQETREIDARGIIVTFVRGSVMFDMFNKEGWLEKYWRE
jgi:hypothetical protein